MNSPAWRTQRSLAIVTFDEDATDGQRPAQRIPTLVLASQGVRPGYTDPTRYTHYSMLRTVESALGLGTLTANDRYAPAFLNWLSGTVTPIATATRQPGRPLPAGYAPYALAATVDGVYVVDETPTSPTATRSS
jgi:hypothetical protein